MILIAQNLPGCNPQISSLGGGGGELVVWPPLKEWKEGDGAKKGQDGPGRPGVVRAKGRGWAFDVRDQQGSKVSCAGKAVSVRLCELLHVRADMFTCSFMCDGLSYLCTCVQVPWFESLISEKIITDFTIVAEFSVQSVYVRYMRDPCKYHDSIITVLVTTLILHLFWQSFLLSIVCERRMTAPCQSIVKIISQSNSEIGCSLIKQWDYMSASEWERWEETDWNRDGYWELFERKTQWQKGEIEVRNRGTRGSDGWCVQTDRQV